MLDSASNTVIAVLDSAHVASYTDTLNRYGTITFNPNMYQVESPVYIRARIVADSNVARWSVETLTMFEGNQDTTGNGGFAKQVSGNYYYATPAGDNPIELSASPNPFTNHIRILYSVPVENADDITSVQIYNVLGNDVTTMVNEITASGRHALEFDGGRLKTGVYTIVVREKNNVQSRMVVRIK